MIQIYSPSNTNYTNNGNCVLMPSRCEITAELNGAWVLQLEHPIDDEGRWKYIEENAVLKVPTWMGTKLQRYRIRVVEKTDIMVAAQAYPIFFDSRDDAYIFDIRVSNKTASAALTQLLTAAPAKYSASSDLTGNESEVFQNCNLLEAITGKFLERWGGEILYNNNQVIVNQSAGGDYGVTVEYGKNITGVDYTVDMTDVATRLIPYAYNARPLSGNSPWVDSSLVSSYPKVFIRAVTFEDIKLAEDASDDDLNDDSITVCVDQAALDVALTAACNAMYADGIDKPKISMSINMLALEDTEEYKGFSGLEMIKLGDTVHCKHSKLGITSDAKVVGIVWDCARDRIASVTLGEFAFDFVRNSGIDELKTGIEEMAANLNPDGSLMAERIKGLLNGMAVQLNAQYTAAHRQDVMAILFENLDPQSPLYGALGIGTQGLQISKQRTVDDRGWVWTTAATAAGVVADTVVTGTLSDSAGKNYWDLDNGDMSIIASSFKLVDGGSQKTIQQIAQENVWDSGNLLLDPIVMSTAYWTRHGTVVTGQTDPYGGTKAIKLTPASDEGYIQAKTDVNCPFKQLGVKYRASVWLKASNSYGLLDPINLYFNGVSCTINPTTDWTEYSVEITVSALSTTMPNDLFTIGGMSSFTAGDGYDLYIYRPRVTYAATQQETFDDLTNHGLYRGIWLENGELFINMDFLQGGTAKFGGLTNGDGLLQTYNASGQLINQMDNEGLKVAAPGNWNSRYLRITGGSVNAYDSNTLVGFFCPNTNVLEIYGANATNGVEITGPETDPVTGNTYRGTIARFTKNGVDFYKKVIGGMTVDGTLQLNKDLYVPGRDLSTGYSISAAYDINTVGNVICVTCYQTSDERLKENIKPTDINIIDSLRVVSFDWKKDGSHVSAGLIAQDVQKICPELVAEQHDGMLTLNYTGIIPHLIKKVQSQQEEIDDLKKEIAEIKNLLKGR